MLPCFAAVYIYAGHSSAVLTPLLGFRDRLEKEGLNYMLMYCGTLLWFTQFFYESYLAMFAKAKILE